MSGTCCASDEKAPAMRACPALFLSISFLWAIVTGKKKKKKVNIFVRHGWLPLSRILFIAHHTQVLSRYLVNDLIIEIKQFIQKVIVHKASLSLVLETIFFSLKGKQIHNFNCQPYSLYNNYLSLSWFMKTRYNSIGMSVSGLQKYHKYGHQLQWCANFYLVCFICSSLPSVFCYIFLGA